MEITKKNGMLLCYLSSGNKISFSKIKRFCYSQINTIAFFFKKKFCYLSKGNKVTNNNQNINSIYFKS